MFVQSLPSRMAAVHRYSGCPREEILAFAKVRRAAGGNPKPLDGGIAVAGALVEVGPH